MSQDSESKMWSIAKRMEQVAKDLEELTIASKQRLISPYSCKKNRERLLWRFKQLELELEETLTESIWKSAVKGEDPKWT